MHRTFALVLVAAVASCAESAVPRDEDASPGSRNEDASAGSRGKETGPSPRDGGPTAVDGAMPASGAAAIEPEDCVDEDWCWAHGVSIRDLHGAGPDAVFAVGDGGTLLEWTKAGWRKHARFTRADLKHVWVAAANDVWVTASDRSVFRYDGSRWSLADVQGLAVTGTAPDDVWLDTQHFDGAVWRDHKPEGLLFVTDLLAVARDEVWAVGSLGDVSMMSVSGMMAIMRFDGVRWKQMGQPLVASTYSLVHARGEVWAYAYESALRYDGAQWVELPGARSLGSWQLPDTAPVPGETRLLHDGQDFLLVPAHTGCDSAFSASPSQSFCHGDRGRVFHFDGSTWARASHDPFGSTLAPEHFGRFPTALWAGDAKLAWGSSPTDVFRVRSEFTGDQPVVEMDVLEHYDGTAWREVHRGAFLDITGSAADNVWIVGNKVLHHDGRSTEAVALPAELGDLSFTAAHTFGPGATWFVAQRWADATSLLIRYDGAWSIEQAVSTSGPDSVIFEDIAGPSEADLWAVARGEFGRFKRPGSLWHYDGSEWRSNALWQTWGFTGLAVGDDRLWFFNREGVYELKMADIPMAVDGEGMLNPSVVRATRPAITGRLWLGASDLWMTTADQAQRSPL